MSRALILIDFINEFLHPEGKIAPQGMGKFCEEHLTITNVVKLIKHFRQNREEIIWVHLGFHENYDNCSKISPRFQSAPSLGILRENTWSTEFLAELGHNQNEKTITKTRVSPFYQTELEAYLREKGIDEVVVAGVATELAVSSVARDLHDRDFRFNVVSDACGTVSLEHHEAALIGIGKLGNIQTTDEIINP
ncbi:MAG: cysteine hydrolase [Candidatus Gracilibacteria bacterium]|nr:cysteine hydrolase [Candidatus Gracilibacteria bacterium]